MRNHWEGKQRFVKSGSDWALISWDYLKNLQILQDEIGMKLANKLSRLLFRKSAPSLCKLSKHHRIHGWKQALHPNNKKAVCNFLAKSKEYIPSLRTVGEMLVCETNFKTGFSQDHLER